MNRILNSKIFSGVLLGLLVWLGVSALDLRLQEKSVNNGARSIESKIETTKKENSQLEKYISYMQNPSFLEREAKLNLNYKNSDEQVVFVYRDTSAKNASASSEDILKNKPNYLKWWYWMWGY